MKPAPQGILVIQCMGLGDLLFSIPVLRVLNRTFPDDPITFVTNHPNASLLSLVPEVEKTLFYRSKNPLELARLVAQIRASQCRMAIVLNPIFRGAVLARLAGIPMRVGYLHDYERKQSLHGMEWLLLTHAFTPTAQKMHEVDRYLDLLAQMGWPAREDERVPQLLCSKSRGQLKGHRVVIHPGAGWVMRRWPEERFAQLADWLVKNCGAQVSLVGGEEEQPLAERIHGRMTAPAENMAGALALPQLAEYLAESALFIGNDTGTLHLAAAVGVPTVGLFGPGDPEKVRPLSSRSRILHHPVPWGPCRVQYTRRCENNLCMQDIRLEEVQEAAAELLGVRGSTSSPRTDTLFTPPKPAEGRQPKKILYLQSTSEISGTDITLLRTVEILDRARWEPHIVLHREGPFAEEYRKAGCRVHLVPSMRQLTFHRGVGHFLRCIGGYPFAVAHIASLIRREKIHLVHTNTVHNPYGFLAALLSRRPHLWHIRELVVQSSFFRTIEQWAVNRFSTRFIVMDNAIAEMFLKPGGGLPAKIAKLYDGVDVEQFHPQISGSRIRRELGISETTPLVGMVGRLDPAKGPELFLEAAARIHAKVPSSRFLVCGGEIFGHAGYEAALRRKAAVLGIEQVVFFTGWTYRYRDIPEVYGALDLSLQCPVYPEPYGLAHVEAMASGVPVVAFAQGGPTELCVNGETALLVPPGDAAAAAEAVANLLKDPEKARTLGEAGRKRAETYFDRRRCVRDLEILYESVLEEPSSC